ncbi:MAG: phage major capsid protein [Gammaproteobacteria bacterium]|nr:phage major capsid protein [Gammaproteobacteria bacterium]
MSEDFKKLQEQTADAVAHLRAKSEEFGKDSVEQKQALDNIESKMKEFDDANQKLVEKIESDKKSAEELKERLDVMEKEFVRMSAKGVVKESYKDTPEYKAFNSMVKDGVETLNVEQKQTLRMDNAVQGGYLTMPEMSREIIKKITETSPVRSVSRVRGVSSKTLEIPTRDTLLDARYEGEAAPALISGSTYGSETLTVYRLSVKVPYTMDLLMDAEFDIASEIMNDVAERFAQKEGEKFVLGTGSKQPCGFLVDPILVADASETAAVNTLDFDDMKTLTGELKVGYRPHFTFNRRTKALLSTLKGSDGQYLWQMADGPAPATINGDPYILFENMPDVDSGEYAVAYADFSKGYQIIDRTGMTVIRNPYTEDASNIITMTFHMYNHGQVILPEAFKLLQIKSS